MEEYKGDLLCDERRWRLLCFGGCFTSWTRELSDRLQGGFSVISLHLPLSRCPSATSLPVTVQCHLTSISPLPMLCLCRPLLHQMDCRCVPPREEDLLPPIFQFTVIYPPHSVQENMHKLFRCTGPSGHPIYHKLSIWALILICD